MTIEYSLADVLEGFITINSPLRQPSFFAEAHGAAEVGESFRGAIEAIGEKAGFIKQGLA